MGMSTHIKAFIPDTDPMYQRYKAVAISCMENKVTLPDEVADYFNERHAYPGMFDNKIEVELKEDVHFKDWHDTENSGFEVDLTKLPAGVTKLRFYNNW